MEASTHSRTDHLQGKGRDAGPRHPLMPPTPTPTQPPLAQTSATTMRVCGLWAAFPFLGTICGNPRASLPGGCQVGLFFSPSLDQDELVYPAHDMVLETASGN